MIGFTPRCSSPNFHAIGCASTGKPSKIQRNQALLPRECPPAMRITQVHGPKWLPHLHFFILLDSQYSNDAREIYAFCCWFTVPLNLFSDDYANNGPWPSASCLPPHQSAKRGSHPLCCLAWQIMLRRFQGKPLDLILRWLSFTINHHNSPWENYLQHLSSPLWWCFESIITRVLWIGFSWSPVHSKASRFLRSVKNQQWQVPSSSWFSSMSAFKHIQPELLTASVKVNPKVEITRDLFKHTANNIMLGILPPSLAFPSFAAAHHRALRPRKSCPYTIYLRGQVGMHNNGDWYGGGLKPMILYIVFGDEHPS